MLRGPRDRRSDVQDPAVFLLRPPVEAYVVRWLCEVPPIVCDRAKRRAVTRGRSHITPAGAQQRFHGNCCRGGSWTSIGEIGTGAIRAKRSHITPSLAANRGAIRDSTAVFSIRASSGLRPALAVICTERLAAKWMSGLLREKSARALARRLVIISSDEFPTTARRGTSAFARGAGSARWRADSKPRHRSRRGC